MRHFNIEAFFLVRNGTDRSPSNSELLENSHDLPVRVNSNASTKHPSSVAANFDTTGRIHENPVIPTKIPTKIQAKMPIKVPIKTSVKSPIKAPLIVSPPVIANKDAKDGTILITARGNDLSSFPEAHDVDRDADTSTPPPEQETRRWKSYRRAGALIPSSCLDGMCQKVISLFKRLHPEHGVLFLGPFVVQMLLARGTLPCAIDHGTRIHACLLYTNHFVLVIVRGHIITVYDSMLSYSPHAARDNILSFKTRIAELLCLSPRTYIITRLHY